MWQAMCIKDGPVLQWWGNRHWNATACDYPCENSSPTGSNAGHARHSGFGPAKPISSQALSLKLTVWCGQIIRTNSWVLQSFTQFKSPLPSLTFFVPLIHTYIQTPMPQHPIHIQRLLPLYYEETHTTYKYILHTVICRFLHTYLTWRVLKMHDIQKTGNYLGQTHIYP